jgi:hypothetical protein
MNNKIKYWDTNTFIYINLPEFKIKKTYKYLNKNLFYNKINYYKLNNKYIKKYLSLIIKNIKINLLKYDFIYIINNLKLYNKFKYSNNNEFYIKNFYYKYKNNKYKT